MRVAAEHPLQRVHDWAAHYEGFWRARLDRLGRHLDQAAAAESAPVDSPEGQAR